MSDNTHSQKQAFRLSIEPTGRITRLPDGALCRAWEGRTPAGVPCLVFVPFVSIHGLLDASELEAALQEVSARQDGAPEETHPFHQVLFDHAREHVGSEALVIHRRKGGSHV